MKSRLLLAVMVSSLLLESPSVTGSKHPMARHVELSNESGEQLQINWLNPVTGELIPYGISDAANRKILSFESFVNHTFVFRSLSSAQTNNETNTSSGKLTYVKVGDPQSQLFVIKKDLEVDIVDNDDKDSSMVFNNADALDETNFIVGKCRAMADREIHKSSSEIILKNLMECLTQETAAILVTKNEELAFQRELRKIIANQAENYTCADPTLTTSRPIANRTWTYENTTHTVGILHSRPASQIHILPNFITASECEAIRLAAEPSLHRGTVADGKGGSQLSENRKAWQAGIGTPDWNDPNDPIAAVKRRIYAYANSATGYNMSLHGQEDLMSIQYFGEGIDNPKPDRYTPHCDGDCDSKEHKTGSRVATMVMYCDVPALGGATNFQHANVYVKPTLHAGVFFSYMNPTTLVHDEGLTTHSGCPVLEGTKRIAVHWMRVGVDNDNPWDSFDTNTMKLENGASRRGPEK